MSLENKFLDIKSIVSEAEKMSEPIILIVLEEIIDPKQKNIKYKVELSERYNGTSPKLFTYDSNLPIKFLLERVKQDVNALLFEYKCEPIVISRNKNRNNSLLSKDDYVINNNPDRIIKVFNINLTKYKIREKGDF